MLPLTLAINSATRKTSVALISGSKVLGERSWVSKKDEAAKIIPALQSLLNKTKKNWSDVGEVFVVSGPGPFTGLRVGVTIANGLAYANKVPIKSSSVFEYLLMSLPSPLQRQTAIIVKGGGEFFALYSQNDKKEKLLSVSDLIDLLAKKKFRNILFGIKREDRFLITKMLKHNRMSCAIIDERKLKSFAETVVILLKKIRKKSKSIKPLYLQKPLITQSKKEKFT